jgi:hypothetical protein
VIALAPYALRALAFARRWTAATHETLRRLEIALADHVLEECCAEEGFVWPSEQPRGEA